MATGWAHEGAVLEQIDATIKDAVDRARSSFLSGPSLNYCADCGAEIPAARRKAIVGVRRCVPCQEEQEQETAISSGFNRRGSKDSQLR